MDRDCNTCVHHKQPTGTTDLVSALLLTSAQYLRCAECLSRPEELPHYEPDEETMRA